MSPGVSFPARRHESMAYRTRPGAAPGMTCPEWRLSHRVVGMIETVLSPLET
jgi:hypothetical protein